MTPVTPDRVPAASPDPRSGRRQFRRTLLRVMLVQVITVLLLWLIQTRYGT